MQTAEVTRGHNGTPFALGGCVRFTILNNMIDFVARGRKSLDRLGKVLLGWAPAPVLVLVSPPRLPRDLRQTLISRGRSSSR